MQSLNFDPLLATLEPLRPGEGPAPGVAAADYLAHYGLDFAARMPGVRHHLGCFQSSGEEILCHEFHPAAVPRGSAFICHGYLDHSGLYQHLIDYCLSRDWLVVIYDQPGHGLSTGERMSIDSFSTYTRVLQDCLGLFAASAPRPWLAVGQSMGGAVLLDYLLRVRGEAFTSVVLLAPLLRTAQWNKVVLGERLLGRWLKRVRRRFIAGSHDAEFCDFLAHHDPLQSQWIPMRWILAMLAFERGFERLSAAGAAPLVIQGLEDSTVDGNFNQAAIRRKLPATHLYPLQQGRHHLVNESQPIRERIWAAMDLYLERSQG